MQVLSDWALLTTNENGSLTLHALMEKTFLQSEQSFVQRKVSDEILVFVCLDALQPRRIKT
jgi:hypothetical protein